jgi:hypothetical protein
LGVLARSAAIVESRLAFYLRLTWRETVQQMTQPAKATLWLLEDNQPAQSTDIVSKTQASSKTFHLALLQL